MTTILITGFEPFGGSSRNPSGLAVQAAAELWTGPGDLVPVVLPVAFDRAAEQARNAIDDTEPDLVICVGLAAGSPGIRVERVAINIDDARIPDNSGASPIDEPIRGDGPAAYLATLPIKSIVKDLVSQGIVAQVSNTAGTYVCNHVFYSVMDYLAQLNSRDNTNRRGGFLHVPNMVDVDGGACSGSAPTLPLEVTSRALVVAARTALRVTTDIRVTGGQID